MKKLILAFAFGIGSLSLFAGAAVDAMTQEATVLMTSLSARQRYPWNGKVDVVYTLSNRGLDSAGGYEATIVFTGADATYTAKLEGATHAQIFTKIIIPISKPIIIYTALLAFTGPWMDFIFARVVMGQENKELHTVAVGLYQMLYSAHADNNVFTTFAAGCVCVAIPIVTLFMLLQNYYIEGATAGAVKG